MTRASRAVLSTWIAAALCACIAPPPTEPPDDGERGDAAPTDSGVFLISVECAQAQALTEDDCAGSDAFDDPETYAVGGVCWQNAETWDACTEACRNFVDACASAGE